jgi:SagB-type dehydrogenase family enzyme
MLVATTLAAQGAPTNQPTAKGPVMQDLPKPQLAGRMSLEESLAKRRSVRAYSPRRLTAAEVSQILWAAQGTTESRRGFRTAPSAGATFPLETYAVTPDGVFRYVPARHALEEVRRGDIRADLGRAALGQTCVQSAPLIVAFAAVPERTTQRYGARGTMYIHMEAGHAAQNVHLQAVALGLGSVAVGAFSDDDVAAALGLPQGQVPLYLVPVGESAGR